MLASIVATAAMGAPAAPASCPLALPRETLTVGAPPGWTGYAPSLMRLTGFGMMAGPPESMTYLVPSGSRKLKGGATSKWEFDAGEEKWLYCTYGGSSVIQISKRMEDAAKVCELSHKKDEHGNISEMTATCTLSEGSGR